MEGLAEGWHVVSPGELTALTTKSSSTTGIAPKLSVSDLRSPSKQARMRSLCPP